MFELFKFERDLDATSHVYVSLTILKNNYHKPVHREQLTMIIDGPFQIQEKLQYETWNLRLLDELNF